LAATVPDMTFRQLQGVLDAPDSALAVWCGGILFSMGAAAAGGQPAGGGGPGEILRDLGEMARARLVAGASIH